jgi:hypothetical protein
MSREAHVRFDGSGEGKFLPATLLIETRMDPAVSNEQVASLIDEG